MKEIVTKYTAILTKSFLIKEYIENKKSVYQIAFEMNSSVKPIYDRLKKYSISIRNNSESHKKYLANKFYYCKEFNCDNIISVTNFRYGKRRCRFCADKIHSEWMKENSSQIGKKGKLSPNYKHGKTNEKRYCRDCRRETKHYYAKRCKSCACKYKYLNHPEKNPFYVHGNSKAPYPLEFNDKLKEKIRKRDNYICQKCSTTEEEHILIYSYCLVIHHIDYDKMNCEEWNLITLCSQCNVRANFNRDYWENYYRKKIELYK